MIIRGKKIWPPLILAPMAGLTHSALRTLLLGFGGVGLLTTEMLAATRLPAENPHLSPYLVRTEAESPLAYQLLLTGEEHLPKVFDAVHRFRADIVDLNLGCPAPLVRRSGGGSSLMDNPALVRRIVSSARKQTHLPLTAKIRLGEDLDAVRLRDFCVMLVDEGLDMLTVHARLRRESFSRPPRWQWVARIKEWIDIPVVANGAITSVASARACLAASGADGLMIGRQAAVTPWIFATIAREVYGAAVPETDIWLPGVYRQFAQALMERFRPERRLGRLKEYTHYFAGNYPFGHHLASRVQASGSFPEACQRSVEFFAENEPRWQRLETAWWEWFGFQECRAGL
ncbi:tRNA dihydrouridine synthase [Desulfobulbus alkaliphilus]|uniref:tRNA dihydrouridine synthase n=1 Tax=Desulfobulbus alkaliphilus TaxID=869814 RepID=UPI0019637DBE|nr:tRNA-dihydrouridine synthase family protein [Desulfobulbus alkaliphilus]MBM9537341.1 tRNA-dihydrouridine synthase family protein [Desulfobulbus alkaliphilus]